MKLLNLTIISILALTFASCNKNNDSTSTPVPPASIEGVFDGKYGFDNEAPHANYTLNFKPNGTIQEIGQSSGAPTGQGTYLLKGNHLSASYKMLFEPFNDYFLEATFDATSKTITGTWGYEAGATDGGKFSVKK